MNKPGTSHTEKTSIRARTPRDFFRYVPYAIVLAFGVGFALALIVARTFGVWERNPAGLFSGNPGWDSVIFVLWVTVILANLAYAYLTLKTGRPVATGSSRLTLHPKAADSIEKTPGVCGGAARIKGTRIPVWQLAQARDSGASEAELLLDYPRLKARDLVDAWEYAEENPDEIRAEVRRNEVA